MRLQDKVVIVTGGGTGGSGGPSCSASAWKAATVLVNGRRLASLKAVPEVIKAAVGRADGRYEALLAKHPLGLGRPDDVAWAALYLASEEARWVRRGPARRRPGGWPGRSRAGGAWGGHGGPFEAPHVHQES